jgi:hypothetical protein
MLSTEHMPEDASQQRCCIKYCSMLFSKKYAKFKNFPGIESGQSNVPHHDNMHQ